VLGLAIALHVLAALFLVLASGLYSGASTASWLVKAHCSEVAQPAFAGTIQWDGGHVTAPDALHDLAHLQGVEVTASSHTNG
jgi:hypothetical protein